MHMDCLRVLDDTVDLLTSLGHTVVERELTELTPEVGSAIGRLYGAGVDWAIRYWARETGRLPGPHELGPLTRLYWERGREVRGGELLMALTTVQAFGRAVAAAYDGLGFDVWLSPTLAEPPPRLGELAATADDPTVAEARSAAFVAFPLVDRQPHRSSGDERAARLEQRRPARGRELHGPARRRGHAAPARRPARVRAPLGRGLAAGLRALPRPPASVDRSRRLVR